MSPLISSVLKPVSNLKFRHFQSPRQQGSLIACQILLAGKNLLEILKLTLGKMATISPFPLWPIFVETLY